ncbi:hypothetical protein, partial [Pseudomonas savastanoi]|uniref:hypothetical protein n=1 Tax=Pseudomonas savastanoi TaxID=29438 RepID=UPI001C7F5062
MLEDHRVSADVVSHRTTDNKITQQGFSGFFRGRAPGPFLAHAMPRRFVTQSVTHGIPTLE